MNQEIMSEPKKDDLKDKWKDLSEESKLKQA